VTALAVGGMMLSRQLKKNRNSHGTSTIEESSEVNVPLRTAYNQWTQFEEFPKFMENVLEVRQLDDRHLHWRAKVAGEENQWDAEITEQIPDKRIGWRSVTGARNGGVVTFHKLSDTATRNVLQMEYEPQRAMEKLGDAIGAVRMEARRSLQRFKEMLEQRGSETGAWRGQIAQH
jgi:uncharacterized membrane protein